LKGKDIHVYTKADKAGAENRYAQKHFKNNLKGKIVLTGGLGGMGGAQPLAVTMNHGVCLAVECDEKRIDRRIKSGFCNQKVKNIDEAVELVIKAKDEETPFSVGVLGNCADIMPKLVKDEFKPDVVTDQTSAHDELNGYVPTGYYGNSLKEAFTLRKKIQRNISSNPWRA
jgi:urocanate hydratase